jgi:hypothetical protein
VLVGDRLVVGVAAFNLPLQERRARQVKRNKVRRRDWSREGEQPTKQYLERSKKKKGIGMWWRGTAAVAVGSSSSFPAGARGIRFPRYFLCGVEWSGAGAGSRSRGRWQEEAGADGRNGTRVGGGLSSRRARPV